MLLFFFRAWACPNPTISSVQAKYRRKKYVIPRAAVPPDDTHKTRSKSLSDVFCPVLYYL
jgi:hypothetical protein